MTYYELEYKRNTAECLNNCHLLVPFMVIQLNRVSQCYGSLVITLKPKSGNFSQFNSIQFLLPTDKDRMVKELKLFNDVSTALAKPCGASIKPDSK
jgi:hypothetical protein